MPMNGWIVGFGLLLSAAALITSAGLLGSHFARRNTAGTSPPTPSPSPAPVPPPPVYPEPPVAPTTFLCTNAAEDWSDVNISCYPEPPNDPDEVYCRTMRDPGLDFACFRAACTYPMESDDLPDGVFFDIGAAYASEPLNFTYIRLDNTNASLGGLARVPLLIQKFLADNDVNPPQPLNSTDGVITFTSEDFLANVSFYVQSQQFARAYTAAVWNTGLVADTFHFQPIIGNPLPMQFAITQAKTRLVLTPARCPDSNFSSIGWLRDNNITWIELIQQNGAGGEGKNLPWFVGLNTLGMATPELWPDFCANWLYPWFCDLFGPGRYYSFASLSDMSIKPNPYEDFSIIMHAFSREFRNCSTPRGCFGLIPPPAYTVATSTSFCTFPPATLAVADNGCYPSPGSNYNVTYCMDFRNHPLDCVIAACTVLLGESNSPNVSFTIGRVTLVTNDAFPDGGLVRMLGMIQQFQADNNVSGVSAQPMNVTQVFTQDDYGVVSFATSGTQFALLVSSALYSREMIRTFARNESAHYGNETLDMIVSKFDALVYSPSFLCTDEVLPTIPWVRTFEAYVTNVITAANVMLGADLTEPQFQPENWIAACPGLTNLTIFCDQFDDYYALESLHEFDLRPSPYEDLKELMRIFLETYPDCDMPPGDCIGIPQVYPVIP
jgi:hypothetical protein